MNTIWWCPVCTRTYRDGQQRTAGPVKLCAYKDCNCLAEMAQINWQSVRKSQPLLPAIPESNHRYAVNNVAWR